MTGEPVLADSLEVDATELARFLGLRDHRFFEHEYRTFKPERSVFVQARLDGRLIGTQGIVPYPLFVGGKPLMSGRTERAMVDPKWRTGGLFAQLMRTCVSQAAEKGCDLLWGMTGLKVPFQYSGFLFFEGFYEHALLCVAPTRIAEDLRGQQDRRMRAAKLAATVPSLCLRAAGRFAPAAKLDVLTRPRNDRDVDELYRQLRGRMPLVVMRHEPAFLDWLDAGRGVERFYAYDGEALAAYAYVDLSSRTKATILDFAARDARCMRTLIRAIVRAMSQRGVAFLYVSYNVTNPLLARQRTWLVGEGFVPFHRGGGFVVRPLRFQDYNYLGDMSRWYITRLWNVLYHQAGLPEA
ncbi:MAG: hypothetical protein HOV81_38165 [Kofleriaceae bacterium]|nr:hypothetical protein [Kofleriaceae bacterium]